MGRPPVQLEMGHIVSGEASDAAQINVSIVILTYARDPVLRETLARLALKVGRRRDLEVVLVDNNPDSENRSTFLADFPFWQLVKTGENKGVSARNDGMAVARGEIIVLLDDDVLVETDNFLGRFDAAFEARKDLGLVVIKKLDGKTMTVLPECVPHNRKSVDISKPFLTFRFTGGLVALRRSMYRQVGGFSGDLFFGQEEFEYSFRIIKAGWKILYDPSIVAIETNASGGRIGQFDMQTAMLTNRYIIAYLHMPLLAMVVNWVMFTLVYSIHVRGRLSLPRGVRGFFAWLRSPGRAHRQPLDQQTLAYIRECGGVTWR